MVKAGYNDKAISVDILSRSFNDNKSVNYIIKQDDKRDRRLKKLMTYSFEICYHYGKVFLTNDKKGCALILLPDKKTLTLRSVFLGLDLALSAIGMGNIKKAISREAKISKLQLKESIYYL